MKTLRAILVLGVAVAATVLLAPPAQASGGLKVGIVSATGGGTTCTVVVQADWHPKKGQRVVHFALQSSDNPVPLDQEQTVLPDTSTATATFVVPTNGGVAVWAAAQVRSLTGEELAADAMSTRTAVGCF